MATKTESIDPGKESTTVRGIIVVITAAIVSAAERGTAIVIATEKGAVIVIEAEIMIEIADAIEKVIKLTARIEIATTAEIDQGDGEDALQTEIFIKQT